MISPTSHTLDWITSHRESMGAADPIIVEKAIYALTLLDALASTNLDFIFKGGTALLLHLPQPKRLSIDIDIASPETQEFLEATLTKLIEATPFTRWDESVRAHQGLPGRRHYRFHYPSPTQNKELHILLDIVTEPNVLQHLESRTIATSFLDIQSPVSVQTPKLESLLADKLTAFAPNSVGVPLTASFSQQVLKQLFDIAQLYDLAEDLAILRQENLNSFQAEAGYCNYNGTHHNYLDDLIETAFRISALDLRGAPTDQPDQEQLLRQGIRQLSNHLVADSFTLPQAKIAASKAACLASLLKSDQTINSLPRFTPETLPQLKAATIEAPHQCLNRLKSFAPEAFFHWLSQI